MASKDQRKPISAALLSLSLSLSLSLCITSLAVFIAPRSALAGPPFCEISGEHQTIPYEWNIGEGVVGGYDPDGMIDAPRGTIYHGAFSSSYFIGLMGVEVKDGIRQAILVHEPGWYNIQISGRFSGKIYSIGGTAILPGVNEGVFNIWLEADMLHDGIVLDGSIGSYWPIYKSNIVRDFLGNVAWGTAKTLLGQISELKTLPSIITFFQFVEDTSEPVEEWEMASNPFILSVEGFLEAENPYELCFNINSQCGSECIGLGGHTATVRFTVQIEDITGVPACMPECITLVAVAGAHGTVDPAGTTYVKAGGSITLNATPDTGYSVDKWYINDQPQAGSEGRNSLPLSNIQKTTTVLVTFRIAELIVTRPAVSPYRTGDSEVTFIGTAPINTHIVRWENTTTGDSGDTGDPPGTTWVESIYIAEGSNTIIFRAYDVSDNLLASASIEVIRVNNVREAPVNIIGSCWISSGHPKETLTGTVYVGCDPTRGYYNERGLVRSDAFSLPPGSTIENATFAAWTAVGDHTGSGTMGVTVRRITSPWSLESVTWNNQPDNTTTGQTTVYVGNVDNQLFSWDITGIAQSWHSGSSNDGLVMISQSEDIGYNLERVFQYGKFTLRINYSVETQVPQIQITSPTSNPSYATGASSVSLAGTASDNYQVSRVDYRNQTTGASGTASGTTSWSCTVPLTAGWNTISVIAYDASENSDSDTIAVLFLTPPTTVFATDDIMEHVFVQWEPVTDAGYYRVYRSESETEMKSAVSAWIDALSFVDTSTVPSVSYYYWVAASADSSGTVRSDYAGPAIGKRPAPPDSDLNGDGRVNFPDFSILAKHWLKTCSEPGWCEGADLDWSGEVEWPDFQIMVDRWLEQTQGRIAFCIEPNKLLVMNADGSGRHEVPSLSEQFDYISSPQWSPEGTWLAFRANGGPRIYIVKPDGSSMQDLTDGSGGHDSPTFSPDGTRVAFHKYLNKSIYTVNIDGTNLTEYPVGFWVGHTRWSPNGRYIAYTDWSGDYGSNIFLYDFTTGESTQVTHSGYDEAFNYACWSPDGAKLAIAKLSGDTGKYDIWIMNIDGSEAWNLTQEWPSSSEYWPSWSRNGYIVFLSDASGNNDIWYTPISHFAPVNLTNSPENEQQPAIDF